MKYLKRFNESKNYHFIKGTYEINPDGFVDVDGDVMLWHNSLSKLPLKFGKVSGHFECPFNNLTSLEGCPTDVGGDFKCFANKITSLEHGPINVGGDYLIGNNMITNLKGAPKYIPGTFDCVSTDITSLEGCPEIIDGDFFCRNNKLYDVYDIGDISGHILLEGNPVSELTDLSKITDFPLKKFIKYLNEFRPIRGKTILGKRLEECLYMCDVELDITKINFRNYTLLE